MNLCNDGRGILNANVKDDENFEDEDFMNEEIDPLDIGFQDENYKSCFNIRVKSEGNEDFVDAKDELLLVEDGLVLEGFGGQSTNGSNECEDINVVKEELPVFANYILEEDNCQPADECEVHLRSTIKEEDETVDDMDFINEEMDPINFVLLNEDCGGRIDVKVELEDDPQPSTSSGEEVNVLGRNYLKLNQAAVESSVECDVSFQSFDNKHSFTKHFNSQFQNKKIMCNICERRFTEKKVLKKHLRIHSGERPHECDSCEKRFTEKSDLIKHLRIHSGERPFECNVCEKRFTQKQTLKMHLRIHSGERPFECDICEKRFTAKQDLEIHMRIHTGERPFECTICKKNFLRSEHLKNHMLMHSGERPFECNVCEKRFARKQGLKMHLRTHCGDRPFECDVCEKRFTVKQGLKKHMRIHSGDKPFECDVRKDLHRSQI